ncbi:MAG: hypothetical protein AB7N61_13195 [Acidimicrobiia bacterium]
MTAINLADRSLVLAATRLTTGRRAQRLTIRWAHDPHLRGRAPAELLDTLARPGHPDHDNIVRGLISRSQHQDEDATILLLCALRPGLWKLAHDYHRARLSEAFDDLVVNAVHVIARTDPSIDRLYDRILGRVRAATPRASRDPHVASTAAELADIPSAQDHDIVDQLQARDNLRRLGQLRRADALRQAEWNDLVAVRVHGIYAREIARGRTTNQVRADISRFSHRLQRFLAA